MFKEIQENTGLKTNYSKSTTYRTIRGTQCKLNTSEKIKWSNETISALGIKVKCQIDPEAMLSENYGEILKKMKNIFKLRQRRDLCLIDKVNIVNTLTASLFVYKMKVVPTISKTVLWKYEKMTEQFIWNGRNPKIKLSTLKGRKQDGGLRLVHLEKRDKVLKVQWVNYLHTDQVILSLETRIRNAMFWMCNFKKEDIDAVCKSLGFWQSVVEAWAEYNFSEPSNYAQVVSQVMLNSHLRIADKLILYNQAYMRGMHTIEDIIEENSFLGYNEIVAKFGTCINIMQYNAMISCIPQEWKMVIRQEQIVPPAETKYEYLSEFQKVSKILYEHFITNNKLVENVYLKWCSTFSITYEELVKAYGRIYKLTTIDKYRSFQFRILYRMVLLNDRLYHMDLVPSQRCSLCGRYKENIYHFFWECERTQEYW